ncbi:hypothetical protein BDV95DRAFT_317987 [Massariosphaeria phaeospora]|uniref:Uncharacterized protein n=1 Tax=Massariosphaeria phaeospora TaxID=100035 RepID=A0A7C8MSI8_9PLEO|nr:hypothetical protein BDV95DRAFT_317987 [Massariosphaeria phaeospora]
MPSSVLQHPKCVTPALTPYPQQIPRSNSGIPASKESNRLDQLRAPHPWPKEKSERAENIVNIHVRERGKAQALDQNCGYLAEILEATPEHSKNSTKDRFGVAEVYSECLATQYTSIFACSKPFTKLKFVRIEPFPAMKRLQLNQTSTWENATIPSFTKKGGKEKLPRLVPIMEKACVFDYGYLTNSTCCENLDAKEPCGEESFNLLSCSIQSLRTYVGCTAKDNVDVSQCVVGTASRINFVPIGFQIDSNGNACPEATSTIMHLARVTIVDFFVFFLFDNPGFWIRIWRRFVRGENIAVRTRSFRVSNFGLWATIAKDVCENVVLVGVVLQRQGYKIDLFKNFVMFSVRPRGAFFHALLGYIDGGWGPDAMIDMIAQILLSVFGGYVALFGAVSANHTLDPSRPLWWKTYVVGGAMASIVSDFLSLYMFAVGISLTLVCCGGAAVLAYLVTVPAVLAWLMLIVSPFKELMLMIKNMYNLLRRRSRHQDPESLFSFHNVWFSRWYKISMFISLVLFIGSWMFWNGFLRLSGDLYCPQDLAYLDLTMIGFYAACVVVRKLFSFLQGEKAVVEDEVAEVIGLQEFTKMP